MWLLSTTSVMDKTQIDPWTWQQKFGFAHAWKVTGMGEAVFLAGQGPISADGEVSDPDDFPAQVRRTFENIKTVLEQARTSFESVVKLTAYFTDISMLREYAVVRNEFINVAAPPASTAVEVSKLALPGMMIEVEAIAVL